MTFGSSCTYTISLVLSKKEPKYYFRVLLHNLYFAKKRDSSSLKELVDFIIYNQKKTRHLDVPYSTVISILFVRKFRQDCKPNSKFQIKLHQQIHKIQFLSYSFPPMSEVAHTTEKGEKDMVGIFFTLSVRALSDVDTYYYGINVCLDSTS